MQATGPATRPQLSHRQILLLMVGLMTGMLLAALDQTIVGTALPTIVGELGGINHYSWVVTAYLLASTASTPLYGKVSDLVGRRRVFLFAIVTFVIGSVLAGLSAPIPAVGFSVWIETMMQLGKPANRGSAS